jgi:hypothetical protein
VGIRVVNMKGKTPQLNQYIIRWAFRMIDIMLSVGTMALISIYSSGNGQRLGDILAGTSVISTKESQRFNLKELEKLNKISTDRMNPALTKFEDEEMLVVKTLLNRYKAYPTAQNAGHIKTMARKIQDELSESTNAPAHKYLERVLNDYIVLTR